MKKIVKPLLFLVLFTGMFFLSCERDENNEVPELSLEENIENVTSSEEISEYTKQYNEADEELKDYLEIYYALTGRNINLKKEKPSEKIDLEIKQRMNSKSNLVSYGWRNLKNWNGPYVKHNHRNGMWCNSTNPGSAEKFELLHETSSGHWLWRSNFVNNQGNRLFVRKANGKVLKADATKLTAWRFDLAPSGEFHVGFQNPSTGEYASGENGNDVMHVNRTCLCTQEKFQLPATSNP